MTQGKASGSSQSHTQSHPVAWDPGQFWWAEISCWQGAQLACRQLSRCQGSWDFTWMQATRDPLQRGKTYPLHEGWVLAQQGPPGQVHPATAVFRLEIFGVWGDWILRACVYAHTCVCVKL